MITVEVSGSSLSTSFRAFISAASTTTAEPCWSSQKTGMSSSVWRRSTTVKELGLDTSSMLIAPKVGAAIFAMATMSSAFRASMQSGMAFTSPKFLKSRHLPSITGSAARGPMLPMPRTAEPSLMRASLLAFPEYSKMASGSSMIPAAA
jgi:hypothetical protein